MLKNFNSFVNEINTPETRCTNVTLKSFGICSDVLIMDGPDLYFTLEKHFSEQEKYYYKMLPISMVSKSLNPIDYKKSKINNNRTILAPTYNSKKNNYLFYNKLKGYFYKRTTNQFINTIIDLKAYGHYIIYVNGHLSAIHYLKNGELWMVDNEEKFSSRRIINKIIAINRKNLDKIFKTYLNGIDDFRKLRQLK